MWGVWYKFMYELERRGEKFVAGDISKESNNKQVRRLFSVN